MLHLGKIILSLVLAVIVVRVGRSLRMKLTGASMVVVNSRANMGLILVVAFFIYAAISW